MKVRDCMTKDVHTARPDQSLRDVALEMLENDIGVLPVEDGERLADELQTSYKVTYESDRASHDGTARGIEHGIGMQR